MADTERRPDATDVPKRGGSRALVPLRTADAAGDRPLASFLAQLIACDRRLPGCRTVRTAEPSLAAARYGRFRSAPGVTLVCDA